MAEIEILAQGAIKNIERKNTKDANILLMRIRSWRSDSRIKN